MNFITKHTINRIRKETIDLNFEYNNNGFIYFDEPIIDNNILIDRINTESIYQLEEILPVNWSKVKGTTLLKIYNKLKKRMILIPYKLNGETYKLRINGIK